MTEILFKNIDEPGLQKIETYERLGGYQALTKAIKMSPEEVTKEIGASGIRGRGGAGFPTGKKWEICRSYKEKTKYMICNVSEGDPGAFMKDRKSVV